MRRAAHMLRAPRGATSMPQRAKVCRRIVSRANDVGQRRQRRRYHCPGASRPTRDVTVTVVLTFGSGDHPPPPAVALSPPPADQYARRVVLRLDHSRRVGSISQGGVSPSFPRRGGREGRRRGGKGEGGGGRRRVGGGGGGRGGVFLIFLFLKKKIIM